METLSEKMENKTSFLIEPFIKKLGDFFEKRIDNELYIIDLLNEKIYVVNDEIDKSNLPSLKDLSEIFRPLHKFKLSYEELVDDKEIINFHYRGIFFSPVLKPAYMAEKKWTPLLKFQKGTAFIYPEYFRINTVLLDDFPEDN